MKNKIRNRIALGALLLAGSPVFAQNQDAEVERINKLTTAQQVTEYRQSLGEQGADKSSKVVTSYGTFFYNLSRMIGGQSFRAIEIVGFSGAGYQDIERYKGEVKTQLDRQLNGIQSGGKVVVVLGGSIDGIGAAYDVLNELKKSDKYKNVVVVGMVSDQVVKYQLEGKIKGWGDTLSPHQQLLLALSTEKGSWELIEAKPAPVYYSDTLKEHVPGTSRTVDILLDLAKLQNCQKAELHVFEGGDQALREGLEFSARTSEVAKAEKLAMVLHTGYEPSEKKVKQGKDKGFRAATQLAIANMEFRIAPAGLMEIKMDMKALASAADLIERKAQLSVELQEAVAREEAKDAKSAEANVARANLARLNAISGTAEMVKSLLVRIKAINTERIAEMNRAEARPELDRYTSTSGGREIMDRYRALYTANITRAETLIREIEVREHAVRTRGR